MKGLIFGILRHFTQLRRNCCQVFSKMNTISQIRNCWQFCKMFLLCLILTQVVFFLFLLFFFFLYFYYKKKMFLTKMVKKLHDNNKHNWKGTRGESLS